RPVLDSVVWPEDAQYFPRSLDIDSCHILILFTSESGYYFYKMDDWTMWHAGNTLEDVFEGLKECKYLYNEWDAPDPCTNWFEPGEYFPHYKWDNGDSHWMLAWEIPANRVNGYTFELSSYTYSSIDHLNMKDSEVKIFTT